MDIDEFSGHRLYTERIG